MKKLILLRHGESTWNKENRFTGWTDVDLSEKGIQEANKAGEVLKREGFTFDIAFTSVLKRAIKTLWIVLDKMDLIWVKVERSWRLNERHYGALQGLNKKDTAHEFGEEQVHVWRRSYDIPPSALEKKDPRYPGNEAKYKDLTEEELPLTECLKNTVARFLPYWHNVIVPVLKEKDTILIVAHGNSLRALVKYLDNISDQEIPKLNIPTGVPLIYELDEELKPLKHYYLGDEAEIKKAMQSVANQGKSK